MGILGKVVLVKFALTKEFMYFEPTSKDGEVIYGYPLLGLVSLTFSAILQQSKEDSVSLQLQSS